MQLYLAELYDAYLLHGLPEGAWGILGNFEEELIFECMLVFQ